MPRPQPRSGSGSIQEAIKKRTRRKSNPPFPQKNAERMGHPSFSRFFYRYSFRTLSEPSLTVRIQRSLSKGACCRRAVFVSVFMERHYHIVNFAGFQVDEVVVCRVIDAALETSQC